jgi:lipid-binding SYLF domain-containing protein
MKTIMLRLAIFAIAIAFLPHSLKAQDDKIWADAKSAKAAFLKTDPSMKDLFNNSYGYVIFPNVGKGAVGVGAAGGSGAVYEKGKPIGTAKMTQVTVGAQAGGQAYHEVIFFENKAALDHFKESKTEFSAGVSAVAAKAGASADAKYREGVVVYTEEIGGLMLEASVGGQKFTYKSI